MTRYVHDCVHCGGRCVRRDPPELCPACGKPTWIGEVEEFDDVDVEKTIRMLEEVARRTIDGVDILRVMRCAAWARVQAELIAATASIVDDDTKRRAAELVSEFVDVVNSEQLFD